GDAGICWVNMRQIYRPSGIGMYRWVRATEAIHERLFIRWPARWPSLASVTAWRPLLVTVPDTVTVSPSAGTLGVSESTDTATEPVSVAALSVSRAAASADGAEDHCSSPASRSAEARRAPERRTQRRAGEGDRKSVV